ncbi:MAG: DNA-directed RNA polymerase subunit L [Methanobrevibacter sp.]|uniref:DNA-directed RNA polymerase subunit L n=1 Tax=Methanobrevibacter sp. TaxID=66852 RepID=UPI0025DAA8EF|nr:DNA-directed RNA polymerase subunit L [Methanobrevibacter sp.]MBR0270925.1 DNA-directed RNA polymerase subunit L [Methanobrevibacter sp.]
MNDIKILKQTATEIEFEIEDESHGVCNALRHILMKDEDVEFAVYNIDHPLTGKPIMTIKTNGADPKAALKRAAEELKKESESFKQLIEENL